MDTRILIWGGGRIGSALSFALKKNKHVRVDVFDVVPQRGNISEKEIPKVVPECDVIFLCVPSWQIRTSLKGIKEYLSPRAICVSLAKGIEEETGKTVDSVIEEELGDTSHFAILGGPLLAEEILRDKKGWGVCASKEKGISDAVERLFADTFYLSYTSDVSGVALSGALKNVYALAMGFADGVHTGSNLKGMLFSDCATEMVNTILAWGGKVETALGPAGIGDFFTTSSSSYAKHFLLGKSIAKRGQQHLEKNEGVVSLPTVVQVLHDRLEDFWVLQLIQQVCIQHKDPRVALEHYFSRKAKAI